jgi:hypothetical protein
MILRLIYKRIPMRLPGLVIIIFLTVPNVLLAQQIDPNYAPLPAESAISAVVATSDQSDTFSGLFAKGSPFHAGISIGETYDDNIFISPQKTHDFVTDISPSFDFEKGDRTAIDSNYLNLYFAPTIFLYADHSGQDREDYDADLYYQYQWTRLTLGIGQQFQHLTDASVDLGGLADRNIYTTAANGNYVYNDKLTFFASATQRITTYQSGSGVDTDEWIGDAYELYQVAPKLALGGGTRVGFIDIHGAPHENYEDALMHATYNPHDQISVTLEGGVEYLQYQDGADHLLPIFDLSASYQPWDSTSFSLSASRSSLISYDLLGETYLDTAVQISVRQRFLQNLYLTLSGSYSISDYEFGSVPLTEPRRADHYYTVGVGIEFDPHPWLKLAAGYQRSEDNSSFSQNTFNDNRIDVRSTASF